MRRHEIEQRRAEVRVGPDAEWHVAGSHGGTRLFRHPAARGSGPSYRGSYVEQQRRKDRKADFARAMHNHTVVINSRGVPLPAACAGHQG